MRERLSLRAMAATAAITIAAGGLASCSSVARAVGAERVRPDEFRIVTMAPLEVPPEYNLRPPRPGEPRPQEYISSEEARRAIYGADATTTASDAEQSLVALTGAAAADPAIRDIVDAEAGGIVRRRRGFANRVLFWRGGDSASETNPLDSVDEAERIAREEASRQATGEGEVVIRRSGRGFKLPGL